MYKKSHLLIPKQCTVFLLIIFLIISQFSFFVPSVYAASSPWVQTNWSGGSGQTSWSDTTKFDSSSSVTTSTANQATITANAEKLSNTGFESDLTSWSSSTQTLTLQPDGTAGIDTMISGGAGVTAKNMGVSTILSFDPTQSSVKRLIKFDVSSIAASATCTAATLYFYQQTAGTSQAYTATVYSIASGNSAWPEGTKDQATGGSGDSTWNHLDEGASTNWAGSVGLATSGTDFESSSLGTYTGNRADTAGTEYSSSLTCSRIQQWWSASTNYGLLITTDFKSGGYASSDHATSARRPKFITTYTFGARDTGTTYGSSSGSVKLAPGSNGVGTFTQNVNVGDTNAYNLSAYAYTDGTAVTSSDASLYYNGSTVSTTYTSVGSGWYQLTGTVTGVASSVGAGVQVASGKTVYLDNVSLSNYASSGTLTSSIFDTGQGSDWGTLTYVATTPSSTSATVKVRTSNDSAMSGATDFSSCSAITSGSDISSNTCVTDGQRYVQYLVTLSASDTSVTPTFTSFSLPFSNSNPSQIDLDSPGENSYTNSERPTFRWKATTDASGLSKYVLEIDNPSIGSSQPSGDFTIDNIPTSRTTNYETNKYVIQYDNFSDSDSTNNYISVYTKPTTDWGSSENDGKLREGKVRWKVKAVDTTGNETASSRTLFVDRTSPKVEVTQINEIATPAARNDGVKTTDTTPTLFGKIIDPLSAGDTSQTQDEQGPKIASGPKKVDIKIEKKRGLGYKLNTLYTINMDKPYYTCENKELNDNTKQKCDKYLSFEYTPRENLDLGTYRITLTGQDKADNSSSEAALTLHIATLAQITTPQEKEVIKEETKTLTPKQKKVVQQTLEITRPEAKTALTPVPAAHKEQTKQPNIIKRFLSLTHSIRSHIAAFSFALGEKTSVSNIVSNAIVQFGYLFATEPTKIYGVKQQVLSSTSVNVSWYTNHPANGKINYGFNEGNYIFEQQTDKRTTYHEFVLTKLKPDTEYHYEVMSQNKNYVYDANRKFKTF